MNAPTELLTILNGRSKDLNRQKYAYELGTPGQFGLDVVVNEDPDVDESSMSFILPFADGKRRDGVGDLLEVGGINCERHQKNPVSLLDHGKQVLLPIGKCEDPATGAYTVEIDPVSKIARARVFIYQGKGLANTDPAKENEHALLCAQIFDLWAKRFIRAGSIGYQVIAGRELGPDYETGTPKGVHLLNVLMLECSTVVMPANMDTVKGLRSPADLAKEVLCMGAVCGKPLSPVLVKSFSAFAPEKKVMLGWEGKSETVPVPLDNIPDTKIPPPEWKPGVGAEKSLSAVTAMILGALSAGTMGWTLAKLMGWLSDHGVDEAEAQAAIMDLQKRGNLKVDGENIQKKELPRQESKGFNFNAAVEAGLSGNWDVLNDMIQESGKTRSQADSIVEALKLDMDVTSRSGEWSNDQNRRSLISSKLRKAGLKSLDSEKKAFGIDDAIILGLVGAGTVGIGWLIRKVMRYADGLDQEDANSEIMRLEREGKLRVSNGQVSAKGLQKKALVDDPTADYRVVATGASGERVLYRGPDKEIAYRLAYQAKKSDLYNSVVLHGETTGPRKMKSLRGRYGVKASPRSGTVVCYACEKPVQWRMILNSYNGKKEPTVVDHNGSYGHCQGSGMILNIEKSLPQSKGLEVRFEWRENPSGTPWERRKIWVRDGGSERQMSFTDLAQQYGQEVAKRMISTSIRKGTSNWHEVPGVKSLQKKSWNEDDAKSWYHVTADGNVLFSGSDKENAYRIAYQAKKSGKYGSVTLKESGNPNNHPRAVQIKSIGNEIERFLLSRFPNRELEIEEFIWDTGWDFDPNQNYRMSEFGLTPEKLTQMFDRWSRQGTKSLDMSSVRKKYRPTKTLRRRLRKSVPGSSLVHVAPSDLNAAREMAEAKGLKFDHVGSAGGLSRVKLMGDDSGIDAVAQEFGKSVRGRKSFPLTGIKRCVVQQESDGWYARFSPESGDGTDGAPDDREDMGPFDSEQEARQVVTRQNPGLYIHRKGISRKDLPTAPVPAKIVKQFLYGMLSRQKAVAELVARAGMTPDQAEAEIAAVEQDIRSKERKGIKGQKFIDFDYARELLKNKYPTASDETLDKFIDDMDIPFKDRDSLERTWQQWQSHAQRGDRQVFERGSRLPEEQSPRSYGFGRGKPAGSGGGSRDKQSGDGTCKQGQTRKNSGCTPARKNLPSHSKSTGDTEFNQGVAARLSGEQQNDNPYPIGSEAADSWNSGWVGGQGKAMKKKDMSTRGSIDLDADVRRQIDNSGAQLNYAKVGNGGHYLYFAPGTDIFKVRTALERGGHTFKITGEAEGWVKPRAKSLKAKGKSMDNTDDVYMDDDPLAEASKDMGMNPEHPFSAQVLKRLHEKALEDLEEGDSWMTHLEHPEVKKFVQKHLEGKAAHLDEIEALHAKHHPELPGLGDAETKDLDEEELGETEGELDAIGDELDDVVGDLDEEFDDTEEDKDLDTMDDDSVPADSASEDEPTPEEALEGMETADGVKHFRRPLRRRVKSLKDEEFDEEFIGKRLRRKGIEEIEELTEDEKQLIRRKRMERKTKSADPEVDRIRQGLLHRASRSSFFDTVPEGQDAQYVDRFLRDVWDGNTDRYAINDTLRAFDKWAMNGFKSIKSACPECGGEDCDCVKSMDGPPPEFTDQIDNGIEAMEEKGLEDHEMSKVGEAAQFANELATSDALDEEKRMKAFHYHKTLEGMGQIEDLAAEQKSEFVGDPQFWQEEGAEAEHKDMGTEHPGAMAGSAEEAAVNGPAAEAQIPPAKSIHPHRQACKDAAQFFGDTASTKDWGEPHKQHASVVAKALEEVAAAPINKPEPVTDEAVIEVGEMGEKSRRKSLKQEVAQLLLSKFPGQRQDVNDYIADRDGDGLPWQDHSQSMSSLGISPQHVIEGFKEWLSAYGPQKSLHSLKSLLKRKGRTRRKSVDELKKEEEEAKALRKNLIEQQKQVKELRRMINGIGNMTR